MNFTFLPSSSVLIHSSSGIFVSLQRRSEYVASIHCSAQENADGGMKSPSRGIWHSNGARGTTTEKGPCRESLPERTIPESLDGFWDCVAKASRGERCSEVNCELAARSRRHNR